MRRILPLVFICSALSAAPPPKLRLPGDVRPVKYAAELTLVPGAATFDGRIDIDVTVARPTSLIWLNATELSISKAALTRDGNEQAATLEPGDDDFVALRLPGEIAAGSARLHLEYQGKVNAKNSEGVFQGKDGGETYLYTQFESISARAAFPCFDEPDFKTPWQLTLHVRKTDKAFSNSPEISETDEPDGMKRVVFAPTKPLPSYLVAAAVGPFEIVDAGSAGRNHVPVRIIVPKGKSAQAKYAAEVTAAIVQQLENYFGVPFPYEKIDNVAIAVNAGFAMENAGMVTYDQTIILSDPAIDTISRQRGYAGVAAHELAHQWFGDLVTTAWWDDIWLNEAFATWTSSKILATWKPEWNTRLSDLQGRFNVMQEDGLVTARKIRQPIESKDDISNAFDGITYIKGASVIRMFEAWMGEQEFQKGVSSYLTRYAYKNARVNDFLDSIAAAGKPQLTRAFSTFLEQPGFPEVSVELKCDGAPRVRLSQTRHLPIGSAGSGNQAWQTPVCVRYQTAAGPQSECFLLDSASAEFKLSRANSCPAYLTANDRASGYYVANYQGDLPAKLTAHAGELSSADRMEILFDLAAVADSGHAKMSAALAVAQAFANAPERQVSGFARQVVASSRNLLPPDLLPNYGRFVQKLFASQATGLGWSAKPGENDDTRLLRASLVPFVARDGTDAALREEGARLAGVWLKDRKGVDADMLRPVLSTAAWFGGRDLFDTLVRTLKETKDPQQRSILINALASFHDPKILRESMALILEPDFDPRESFGLIFSGGGDPATRSIPFEFLKSNYETIVKRFPAGAGTDYRAYLPFVGNGFCEEPSRREFVGFFEDKVKDYLGGPRNYAQVLEGIRLCEARHSAQAADVAEFFSKQ
ncbi:MAG TPA: M1 family metallopeptidase [Bryobacteraceae bacterium]|nr:M1 family metallopeptidase [Bryobacteraceae bacterium]